jgi:hypothetical protein
MGWRCGSSGRALLSKYKALNSNPSNYHQKKKFKYSRSFLVFGFFLVVELELRAFTLSHSTSPIFVKGFLR